MNTSKFLTLAVGITSLLTISATTIAANKSDLSGFNTSQQQQIRSYVQDAVPQVILAKPGIVFDAAKKFKQQQQQLLVKKTKVTILAKIKDLLRNPATPVVNPDGKITLVEFFDYQCSVCHLMYPVINAVEKANPGLRIVYKDLPIFGPASVYAAKGSFAAYKQGRTLYLAYRNALFTQSKMEGRLKNEDVDAIAKRVGLNMTKFHADINAAAVNQQIQNNTELAQALQLAGTPALIVAPTHATASTSADSIAFIPGGASAQQLQQAINLVKRSAM